MCGICGGFATGGTAPLSEDGLSRMVAALHHRGPDDHGTYTKDNCALGQTRLSIIDLAGGHQPIFNEDGTVAVVFNGEIYNFAELREDLIKRGHRFQTASDTEVIVHLWEEEGKRCVERLRGMFAFVLYDRRQNVLFGARDRFGQKPLFYHWQAGRFTFASEIKALLKLPFVSRELDLTALDQFLFYQFVPHPRTLFEGISQLPPAHTFIVEKGELRLERYWQQQFEPDAGLDDHEHLQRLEASLADAVSSHLVSDVPVGIFLSGGIDSSLVAALASRESSQPLRSFSIGFPEERYDESQYARLAGRAFGTEHQEFLFEPGDLEARLIHLAETFDQPIADRAALPLMLLSEQTAREVKVVLTGDGGDELFAGYEKYRAAGPAPPWIHRLETRWSQLFSSRELARCTSDNWQFRKLRSRVARRYVPETASTYFKHFWQGWERQRLYRSDVAGKLGGRFESLDDGGGTVATRLDPLNRMLRIDSSGYLPDDLLLKTDMATMAYGLESRAPLLDHRLAATAGRLPIHLKATPQETKIALRGIAARLLPAELVSRPKRGFGVPLKQWFRNELRGFVRNCLVESPQAMPVCFRQAEIERTLAEHESGQRNHASKIYSLLVFELWYRHYMVAQP